jgi:hypothetical protein
LMVMSLSVRGEKKGLNLGPMASFDKRVLKVVPEPAMARLAPAALGVRCLESADRRDANRGETWLQ